MGSSNLKLESLALLCYTRFMVTSSTTEMLLRLLFTVAIYPGFFFIASLGLLAEGLRRMFQARAEGRLSPPLLQPLYDLLKLFKRPSPVSAPALPPSETYVTDSALNAQRAATWRTIQFFMPALAVLAIAVAVAFVPVPGNLWTAQFENESKGLGADLLAVVLLLELPVAVSIIFGAMGPSIYTQVAGSRTAQLAISYLLPYGIAVFGPALVLGSLNLNKIAASNQFAYIPVKLVCGLLFLVTLPPKLRISPLEAGQGEALEGVTTDLNGPPLAFYRLMLMLERAAVAILFTALFVPFSNNPLVFAAGVLLCLGYTGVAEVLFSHVKLNTALKFYLVYAGVGATVWLLVLAFLVKV
ncbi:MAG: NADH-quinone oxidoreductase subunit H [Chloroflexi bacterium]|uniref:NADH-quinone oxidoreductase subunit H n=1 Tax=Candidatus Chlorohelix allophototropha TaxID=3003348 RepID=A0A8T7LXH4_9CHLR|nr:NADH-quinone oxidoreductase subunit H [Chloroflexota bacterium]WJW66793.1 NADH-quinone oxidoreductase subunit H [Chloroflexota bacterium L227-S17]